MKIKLNKPFSANSAVDEFDVKQIKKALNRLNYYQPFEKVGITGIPDSATFNALKAFQKDQGLQPTGTAKPGDETVNALSREASKKQEGQYIWRTVGDNRVRGSHAALNGTVRNLNESPDPGEEFNCRCWSEPVNCEKEFITQNVISEINDNEYQWSWGDYLDHFRKANGQSVTLTSIGWLGPIIDEAKNQILPEVEDQVAALARQIEQGPLQYTTKNTYEFKHITYPIGRATVSTETIGTVTINSKCLIIEADVSYTFFDDFTDPADIRQINEYIQKNYIPDWAPEWLKFHFKKGDWTDFDGTPYFIHGNWETKLSGIIKRTAQDEKQ